MSTIHLVRHAKAKNRLKWPEPDELRPLTKRGHREALGIAARLSHTAPSRLVSSPYVRCIQTLEPLALGLDLPIETTDVLAEGAGGSDALALLLSLAETAPIACCTHGDVVYELVEDVSRAGVVLDGPPEVPVASEWTLEVDNGRVVSARFVEQPPR